MLYHPADCGCADQACCKKLKEDGVEPVGKIDWFAPTFYRFVYGADQEKFDDYVKRWRNIYAIRGWQFPF